MEVEAGGGMKGAAAGLAKDDMAGAAGAAGAADWKSSKSSSSSAPNAFEEEATGCLPAALDVATGAGGSSHASRSATGAGAGAGFDSSFFGGSRLT